MASVRLKKPVEPVQNSIIKRDWISVMDMLTIKDLQEKLKRYDTSAQVKIDPDGQLEVSWNEKETNEQFQKRVAEYKEAVKAYEFQKKKAEAKRAKTIEDGLAKAKNQSIASALGINYNYLEQLEEKQKVVAPKGDYTSDFSRGYDTNADF